MSVARVTRKHRLRLPFGSGRRLPPSPLHWKNRGRPPSRGSGSGSGPSESRRNTIPRRPVEAYRAYYASAKTVGPAGWSRRAPLGRWTGRRPPRWLEERGCVVVPHGEGAWLAVCEDSR